MQSLEQAVVDNVVALAPVKCAVCHSVLDEAQDRSFDERSPCSVCGSKSRSFAVNIEGEVSVRDFLTLLHERRGETMGFSTQAVDGRSCGAELFGESSLQISMEGPTSQGETDSLSACRILMQRLNRDADQWAYTRRPQHVSVDGELVGGGSPVRTLAIQVVRAIATPAIYRALHNVGSYSNTLSLEAAAAALRQSIEHKTPRHGCADPSVVLALDATQLPGLAFDAVVRRFQSDHGRWAARVGYQAIWLVGPQVRLVWRLDVTPDPSCGRDTSAQQ